MISFKGIDKAWLKAVAIALAIGIFFAIASFLPWTRPLAGDLSNELRGPFLEEAHLIYTIPGLLPVMILFKLITVLFPTVDLFANRLVGPLLFILVQIFNAVVWGTLFWGVWRLVRIGWLKLKQ